MWTGEPSRRKGAFICHKKCSRLKDGGFRLSLSSFRGSADVFEWLHELPTFWGALLVCAAFVLPALLGSLVCQPLVARLLSREKDANTALSYLLNTFALYFGVLLALLSVAVFENHNKAEDAVDSEAARLHRLYLDIGNYPDALRDELTDMLRAYVAEISGPGWHMQARGEISPVEETIMRDLRRAMSRFQPATAGGSLLHAQALRALDDFSEARQLRISSGGTAIPQVMWIVLLWSAALNMIVVWLFDLKRSTHVLVGGTLALFIGLVVYMITVLDAPFMGAHGVSPQAIVEVFQRVH